MSQEGGQRRRVNRSAAHALEVARQRLHADWERTKAPSAALWQGKGCRWKRARSQGKRLRGRAPRRESRRRCVGGQVGIGGERHRPRALTAFHLCCFLWWLEGRDDGNNEGGEGALLWATLLGESSAEGHSELLIIPLQRLGGWVELLTAVVPRRSDGKPSAKHSRSHEAVEQAMKHAERIVRVI